MQAMETRVSIAPAVQAGTEASKALTPKPLGHLSPGDTISFTVGKETFFPQKFNGFDVGPVSVTTAVREGETSDEAAARAASIAYTMFDVEFQQKRVAYIERLGQAEPRK